jgi:hypothetical protein
VDEQHGRALPPDEVVHAHPSPHPGSAASAHLLQGQRRRQRLGGSDPTARGSAREDAGGGPATGAAMERRVREGERGGAAAAASSWRDGGGGEQAVVGGKCCHIHPGSTGGCRAGSVSLVTTAGNYSRFVFFPRPWIFLVLLIP